MSPPDREATERTGSVRGRRESNASPAYVSRRTFVATFPAVVGGCASIGSTPTPTARPDSDDDGVPDQADDFPTDPERAVESSRTEGSPRLRPGEFAAGFALSNHPDDEGGVLHYEASVVGDAPVDCLVLRRDAWDAYVDGARDVSVVDAYSRVGVTEASLTERLGQGEFIFTVDYTNLVTEPGAEPVEVSYVVSMADTPPTRDG